VVQGTVRSLLRLLEALILSLLFLAALAAWRLSQGPLELDVLTPYVAEALSVPGGPVRIELDGTVLTWAGWERALDLRAVGVRAVTSDGTVRAAVPEISLSLSGRALLKGEVAPRTIELINPRLHLVRGPGGAMRWGLGGSEAGESDQLVARLFHDLARPADPSGPAGHLTRVNLVDAQAVIEDEVTGTTWRAPDADLLLLRDETGIAAEVHLLVDAGGVLTEIDGHARFRPVDGALHASLTVRDLRPDVYARLLPDLAPLKAVDLPVSGVVTLAWDVEHGLDRVAFDVSGGAGTLRLPEPVGLDYAVAALQLRGQVTDAPRRAVIEELHVDLGGPVLTANAVADLVGGEVIVKAEAGLRDLPVDDIDRYWPAMAGPNAREWVTENLSDGIVREARASVAARRTADGAVIVEALDGAIRPEGVTVDYLSPMPPVRNAAAVATFDARSFSIDIEGGEVYGLEVRDGTIVFTGLDVGDEKADIRLRIDGPLADALTLIDHRPLGYTSRLGIAPQRVKGRAAVDLELSFPLLKDLRMDDVAVHATAEAGDVFIPEVLLGLDLSEGKLALDVDGDGMDVSGPVVLGTIPGELNWRENFGDDVTFRSRYRLQATVQEHQRHELRLKGPPFIAPWITGPVRADVVATMNGGGNGRIDAKIDLEPARMAPAGFGWTKPVGLPGAAEVEIVLKDEKLAEIPRFAIRAADLSMDGAVAFDGDGEPRRVDFTRLRYGRTDARGSLRLRPGAGMDVVLEGEAFDAAPLLSDPPGVPPAAVAIAEPVPVGDDELPPMTVDARLGRLWIGEKAGFENVTVSLTRDERLWHNARLQAPLAGGGDVLISMVPIEGTRRFNITSNNAGGLLRAMDIFDDMEGGRVLVQGTVERQGGEDVFAGTARISDYEIHRAPLLARILTVAALTGVLDLLRGDGISFSDLEAPFRMKDGLVELSESRAFGPALGLTARGQIDVRAERMALEGTIVPMYAVNSALGNIPLIGRLLTGEKGSGIFAATYVIEGASGDPRITVNPLAALTPGFLRKFFELFTGGASTLRPAEAATEATPR